MINCHSATEDVTLATLIPTLRRFWEELLSKNTLSLCRKGLWVNGQKIHTMSKRSDTFRWVPPWIYLTFFLLFFNICLSWGCAVYGTQELTIFIPSWGRATHGTQEVNTLRCCLTLFRPARPDQGYLAVLTTGLRWNGGKYMQPSWVH